MYENLILKEYGILETVTSTAEIAKLRENQIIGKVDFDKSKIVFNGKHNILMTTPDSQRRESVALLDTVISFNGNNSVVFLGDSDSFYQINLSLYHNSFCYFGADNYFNGMLTMICSEQCNIIIGDDCMFSSGIWIRTSDVHMIYDIDSLKRINNSKSVFIGDHVWVGQDAKLWKGTRVGSGAIIGADAFTAGKRIPSNTIWGGNPAKLIRSGVSFISRSGTHAFTTFETEALQECPEHHMAVYNFDESETEDFDAIESGFRKCDTMNKRVEYLDGIRMKKAKNRFYIG